jgi:hypothetical protein
MWLAQTDHEARLAWIASIDKIEALALSRLTIRRIWSRAVNEGYPRQPWLEPSDWGTGGSVLWWPSR